MKHLLVCILIFYFQWIFAVEEKNQEVIISSDLEEIEKVLEDFCTYDQSVKDFILDLFVNIEKDPNVALSSIIFTGVPFFIKLMGVLYKVYKGNISPEIKKKIMKLISKLYIQLGVPQNFKEELSEAFQNLILQNFYEEFNVLEHEDIKHIGLDLEELPFQMAIIFSSELRVAEMVVEGTVSELEFLNLDLYLERSNTSQIEQRFLNILERLQSQNGQSSETDQVRRFREILRRRGLSLPQSPNSVPKEDTSPAREVTETVETRELQLPESPNSVFNSGNINGEDPPSYEAFPLPPSEGSSSGESPFLGNMVHGLSALSSPLSHFFTRGSRSRSVFPSPPSVMTGSEGRRPRVQSAPPSDQEYRGLFFETGFCGPGF